MSDISPIRLRALELAVASNYPANAPLFLRFLQGGPGADEVFSPPATGASSTKTKATKAASPPSSPTPAQDVPAQAQVSVPATAPAPTESVNSTNSEETPEALQKKAANAVLALAKVDRASAVSILGEYKVERFGELKPKDYPEFYDKIQRVLAAYEEARAKAKASDDPRSLI